MSDPKNETVEPTLEGEARKARYVGWEFINTPETGSLGQPSTVDALLRDFMAEVTNARKAQNEEGLSDEEVIERCNVAAGKMQEIFYGRGPAQFVPLPIWNTPEKLGVHLKRALNMNCAEEEAVRGAFIQLAIETIDAILVAEEEGSQPQDWQWRIDGALETFSALLMGRELEA